MYRPHKENTMAKELKPGEQVTVDSELHPSKTSEAYKKGLKQIKPGDIGEVVGPAEGRALTVKFNGIETVVSKLRLIRSGEAAAQKAPPAARKPAPPKPPQAKPTSGAVPRADAQPVEKTQQATAPAKESSAHAVEEGAFQLLNAVANKLLLKGGTQVEQNGVVELALKDLPAEVRERLQALIDAKLAFNPKDLPKK
jgi:cell division septation protein DedD